jgi:hypothetical protein
VLETLSAPAGGHEYAGTGEDRIVVELYEDRGVVRGTVGIADGGGLLIGAVCRRDGWKWVG